MQVNKKRMNEREGEWNNWFSIKLLNYINLEGYKLLFLVKINFSKSWIKGGLKGLDLSQSVKWSVS